MFENLSDRLSKTLKGIRGKGRLTENNIKSTLREVRMALLEGDVALPVVRDFIQSAKKRALGREVTKTLDPGQAFLKIVQTELEAAMGEVNESLNLAAQPPAIILMAGLQGAGKTTTVAKLSRLLKIKEN
jgi:signal recognition particle subunit SRP54